MSAEWYYHDGTKEHGPLPARQLQTWRHTDRFGPIIGSKKGAKENGIWRARLRGLPSHGRCQPKPGTGATKASPSPLPVRQDHTARLINNPVPAIILSDGDTAVGASQRGFPFLQIPASSEGCLRICSGSCDRLCIRISSLLLACWQ